MNPSRKVTSNTGAPIVIDMSVQNSLRLLQGSVARMTPEMNKANGNTGAAIRAMNLNVCIPSTYAPPSAELNVKKNSESRISSKVSAATLATLSTVGGSNSKESGDTGP